ncbi:CCD83 protein, partial [Rhinopomastus cyanomelas]|nr:CCD83 protein [Rhinopomastus cyanomelas]
IVTRDDVEESLKEIWQYAKDKEQLLKDLQFQIEETEQKLAEKRRERDCLMEYKNVGSKIEASTVLNLEKDIREVGKDDHRITEHYSDVLKAKEEEYDRLFEKYTELCNEEALKMAVKHLDKNSLREIEENEWLKKEIKKYEKEVHELEASVQLLQEENISLVTKMMDAKLQ